MRRRIRSAAFPVHRHSIPQLLVDGLLVALAYFLAFRLRFEGAGPTRYAHLFNSTVWWVVPVSMVVLALFGLYERLWTFVGQRDYEAVVKGVIVATVVVSGAIALLHPVQTSSRGLSSPVTLPASVIAMFFLLMLVLLLGARFFVHLIVEGRTRSFRVQKGARDVLIVGGGDGGRLVVRELARNQQLRLRPVGFIDDDPRKQGIKDEHGLKVLGTTSTDDLARILDEVEPDEVVIAIPSAPGTLRARVVAACRKRGIPVRTMPTVFELLADGSGQLKVTRQLREVRVEDMLGREPVRMELERVGAYLANEVIMVTGAGGSIGSELCRQIARVNPRRLVLVDHAEDNLFEIVRELEEDRHVRTAVPVLADCKEEERMREVLTEHRPAVVFHAAAYKHVTMMELNPVEAIRNNALATRLVAQIAGELGVGAFVLISTDKAVKPATVMGASKALAEWAVEAAAVRYPNTRYATVRFGNVLGLVGLGGADLPPPDRRRRSGDGHRPADDPVLHDDSGGRAAGHPRRLADRAKRRGVRAGDGRLDQDHRACRDDDPALGARARARHRDRDRRRPSGGEVPRGPVQPLRAPAADAGATDPARPARAAGSAVDGADLRRHQPSGAGRRCGGARRTRLEAFGHPAGGR